ncbi:MAG: diadenylate cyclase, partial [Clostridia bacterium]|nr:diadenylate cyclase [Clostridia bacterium]
GMSENSDAIVVIISEETGTISTAVEGKLVRGYKKETLTAFLRSQLIGSEEADRKKFAILGKVKELRNHEKK